MGKLFVAVEETEKSFEVHFRSEGLTDITILGLLEHVKNRQVARMQGKLEMNVPKTPKNPKKKGKKA